MQHVSISIVRAFATHVVQQIPAGGQGDLHAGVRKVCELFILGLAPLLAGPANQDAREFHLDALFRAVGSLAAHLDSLHAEGLDVPRVRG